MDDYISREAAKKHIVSITTYDSENDIKKEVLEASKRTKWLGGINYALRLLDDIPAADVRPVVRGKWEDIDAQMYTWKIRCSICGHERSMMSTQGNYPNYCEHCGAQMEVEE